MPETPQEFVARVLESQGDGLLAMPPVAEWDTFPFDGDIAVRRFKGDLGEDPRRDESPGDCWRCENPEADTIWRDDDWLVVSLGKPSGLPAVVILFPKVHCDIDSLPEDMTSALGPMMRRIEAAVREIGHIGRVHINRWGDGSAHLHWWFMGRPAGVPQLRGSFAPIWDDILPPIPEQLWSENLRIIADALAADGGTAVASPV